MPLFDPAPEALGDWGANIGPLTVDGQAWRVLTSVFVHFGLLHLAVNMAATVDLGRTAERLFGHGAFLFIFLASGAIGAAASVAWNPWVHSAGASGAIFGILGALLAYSTAPATRVPREVLRSQVLVGAAFVAFTLAVDLAGAGVDHAAHAGGAACGAVLGRLLARPLAAPLPRVSPGRAALAAVFALAAFAAAASAWRNVGPAYAEEQRFVAEARAYLDAEGARTAALRESFRRWRGGEISRETHAADVAEYARRLAETASSLERHRPSAESPSAPVFAQEALVEVLRLRAAGMERRALAVAKGDRGHAAEAERLLAEADARWKQAACTTPRSALLRCAPRKPLPPEEP
jgi:membrane associated rhomboid family serine protease